jgi:integrase
MSEAHFSTPPGGGKPTKPYPAFPLFPHATRRWAKKIGGKMHYFGPWEDPDGALRRYEDFLAGKPVEKAPAPPQRLGQAKPAKPRPDFPLFAHASGRWAKKIRGVTHYFGPWADPDGALKKYLEQKDALHAGRKPRESTDGLAVRDLCRQFLAAKRALVESGELARRSYQDYEDACDLIYAHFGGGRAVADLGPDDFAALRRKLAKKWGPVTLGNVIQRIRVAFKFACDDGLIDRPVRYGQAFKRPSRKVVRVERARKGPKLFTAEEVRRLLGLPPWRPAAGVQVEAMIWLGVNCGLGNSDCGHLPLAAVDLDAGMIDFPRPKTGIPRRCPLWPETVAALRAALAARPEPKKAEHAGLVFITKYGLPWAKDSEKGADQTLAKEFGKLLRALGINGRKGIGFYTLRHTFRTVADESKDQPAVDYIMGHEVPHMSSVYRETISDERLRAVVGHVRAWLFGTKGNGRPDLSGGRQDAPRAPRAG